MSNRLSIALATYNGERYLGEQLESLLHQTRQPDELVVFDDASTDSTAA
ncbi:MAG TPA: glycosyltransferase, partial [Nitrosospira sp.]|nr:glycosyltransferase [Nitrosospira sp.]